VDERIVRVVGHELSLGLSDPGSDGSRIGEVSGGEEEGGWVSEGRQEMGVLGKSSFLSFLR